MPKLMRKKGLGYIVSDLGDNINKLGVVSILEGLEWLE